MPESTFTNMYGLAATSGLMLAIASQAYAATSALTIKGSKFFTSDGNQFFIKGTTISIAQAPYIPMLTDLPLQVLPTSSRTTTRSPTQHNVSWTST